MSPRKEPLDHEKLRLLLVGAGIRLRMPNCLPQYPWTRTVPYCEEARKLVTALVDECWLLAGRFSDYVIVYDNGGQSLPLADLVSQELTRRQKRPIGLLIVRRSKRRGKPGKWRVWYRASAASQPIRLRTNEDFEQIRRKTALCVVDVLEWRRFIIDVAKSARLPKNGIVIAGIACLVKRDGRMRQGYIPRRTGAPIPLFCLVDLQFSPHKPPQDYEDLPSGQRDGEMFEASPSLMTRLTRRFRRTAPPKTG